MTYPVFPMDKVLTVLNKRAFKRQTKVPEITAEHISYCDLTEVDVRCVRGDLMLGDGYPDIVNEAQITCVKLDLPFNELWYKGNFFHIAFLSAWNRAVVIGYHSEEQTTDLDYNPLETGTLYNVECKFDEEGNLVPTYEEEIDAQLAREEEERRANLVKELQQ